MIINFFEDPWENKEHRGSDTLIEKYNPHGVKVDSSKSVNLKWLGKICEILSEKQAEIDMINTK